MDLAVKKISDNKNQLGYIPKNPHILKLETGF